MCAQWNVTFGSDHGPLTYTMVEPEGRARLDVVLVCAAHCTRQDMDRMAAMLTARGIRCFTSTLTPGQIPRPTNPLLPWVASQAATATKGTDDATPQQDHEKPLRDLLSRIMGEQSHQSLAVLLIGQTPLSASDILAGDPSLQRIPGSRARLQIASLTEATGEGRTEQFELQNGRLLVTTTRQLNPATILNWIDARVLPWLFHESRDAGDQDAGD